MIVVFFCRCWYSEEKQYAAVVPTADKLCFECGHSSVGKRPTANTIGNPIREDICNFPEEYKYSSALFYETGIDNWRFLSNYMD